ncbi:MAG: hypothetical protein LJE65_00925 [Desulfobacteraceae bacterium]|nr:hypothetical protein [Desulfobacteraceae bacterium]
MQAEKIRYKNAAGFRPCPFGLTAGPASRYGFNIFSAESGRHAMLGTQSGKTQFGRWLWKVAKSELLSACAFNRQFQNVTTPFLPDPLKKVVEAFMEPMSAAAMQP